jgi:hypothetical protein
MNAAICPADLAEQIIHPASREKIFYIRFDLVFSFQKAVLINGDCFCYILLLADNVLIYPKGMTVNIWPGRPDIRLRLSASICG